MRVQVSADNARHWLALCYFVGPPFFSFDGNHKLRMRNDLLLPIDLPQHLGRLTPCSCILAALKTSSAITATKHHRLESRTTSTSIRELLRRTMVEETVDTLSDLPHIGDICNYIEIITSRTLDRGTSLCQFVTAVCIVGKNCGLKLCRLVKVLRSGRPR